MTVICADVIDRLVDNLELFFTKSDLTQRYHIFAKTAVVIIATYSLFVR